MERSTSSRPNNRNNNRNGSNRNNQRNSRPVNTSRNINRGSSSTYNSSQRNSRQNSRRFSDERTYSNNRRSGGSNGIGGSRGFSRNVSPRVTVSRDSVSNSTQKPSRGMKENRGAKRSQAYRQNSISTNSRNRQKQRSQYPNYSTTSTQLYAGSNQKQSRGILSLIIGGIVKVFTMIGSVIGHGVSFLWNKSKALSMVLLLVIVVVAGISVDSFLTGNKIYQGVSVGSVDLSNKTVDEAKEAINNTYSNKLFSAQTFVFQNDDALDSVILDRNNINLDTLTKLVESEESSDTHTIWLADAITLGAELPVDQLVNQAFAVGRGFGFFDRLGAMISGYNIKPYADYNEILLDNMINDIEVSTGNQLVNWGITINEGNASVTEGHDGYKIDRDSFVNGLNEFFFLADGDIHAYAANVPFVEVRIDQESAQHTCDAVNEAISSGASFTYEGNNINVDQPTLGSWVTTSIDQDGDKYKLNPSIDTKLATTPLVQLLGSSDTEYNVDVSIREENGDYIVQPSSPVVIPSASTALESLDNSLFASYRKSDNFKIEGSQYNIAINSEDYDGTFSIQEALAYGIVETFSTYTTNYSTKASNANRIYNIHLVADLLNNSIAPANGGTWSFNDIVGNTTEEAGFREAGSIIENERTDSIGGGVCQVATTVFNAVYDSGLPIMERHNHSLYMSAYPDGRDAAVAYGLLDLVWENDTPSDILVTMSYTESSVTANLIGVNPNLTVETEVGEWQEGEKYSTKLEDDETLAEGVAKLETHGVDGKIIEVKRTVKDASGNIVREKTFTSVYSPVTQIVKVGPGTDKAEVLAKYDKNKDDSDSDSNSSDSGSSNSSKSSNTNSNSSNNSSSSSKKSGSSNSSSNSSGSSNSSSNSKSN